MVKTLFKNNGILLPLMLLALLLQMTRWGFYVFAIFILLAAASKIWNRIDGNTLFLILFSVSLVILCPKLGLSTFGLICLLGPCTFYSLGRTMVRKSLYNEQLIILLILFVIIADSFLMWMSVMSNIYTSGSLITDVSGMGRMLSVIGGEVITATLFGLVASMGISGLGTVFGYDNRKQLMPWLFFLCFVLSLLTTFYLINRTAIVVGLIALMVITFYKSNNNVFRLVFMLILLAFIGYAVFYGGLIDQQVVSAYSMRIDQDTVTGGDRFWRWGDAFVRMFRYPMGWINEHAPYNYVHNLWLDVARMGGIIPFVFLLIPTITSLSNTFRLFKRKSSNLSVVIISLYSCMFVAAFMEPVIEGCIFFFLLFCWLWGIEQEVVRNNIIITKIT